MNINPRETSELFHEPASKVIDREFERGQLTSSCRTRAIGGGELVLRVYVVPNMEFGPKEV